MGCPEECRICGRNIQEFSADGEPRFGLGGPWCNCPAEIATLKADLAAARAALETRERQLRAAVQGLQSGNHWTGCVVMDGAKVHDVIAAPFATATDGSASLRELAALQPQGEPRE